MDPEAGVGHGQEFSDIAPQYVSLFVSHLSIRLPSIQTKYIFSLAWELLARLFGKCKIKWLLKRN
jgi:hypothetical protein